MIRVGQHGLLGRYALAKKGLRCCIACCACFIAGALVGVTVLATWLHWCLMGGQ